MFNSKITNENGTETDLAYNTRVAHGYYEAEHIGEKTSDKKFIDWCDKKIVDGSFILEKKPSERSINRWRKLYPWDESDVHFRIKTIQEKSSTADNKYSVTISELIIDDLKFIKKLYNERNNLKKSEFKNAKEYHAVLESIEKTIKIIEDRIRVRLKLPTTYNNNKHEVEGNMDIQKEEIDRRHKREKTLEELLTINEDYDDFIDKL